MGVITVRIPDEDEKLLRKGPVGPSRLAKVYLMEQARLERLKKWRADLDKNSVKLKQPSLKIIRELRDSQ